MSAYLDHAAASPLDPRVQAAAAPFLDELFANPGGVHDGARRPAEVLEAARASVGALIGAPGEEVIFTSSATEARNLAVKGLFAANRSLGERIVTTRVEHPATLAACRTATRDVGEVAEVGVDAEGRVAADDLAAALDDSTVLVAVAHGQGEIGTVQDVAALAAAVRARREEVRVFVDAAETAGLIPVDVGALGADAIAIGGPAIGAPPWSGALWVRPGARLHPLIEGGLQEAGKRAGAECMPAVAAMGAAAELARAEIGARSAAMRPLVDRLIDGLLAVPEVRLNGPRRGRLPGHVQVSVAGVEGEALTLALALRGVAVSPGSACTAHAGKAAPALEAIGLESSWTHSAVLLTLRWTTTRDEVDAAIAAFGEAVPALRAMSPVAVSGT